MFRLSALLCLWLLLLPSLSMARKAYVTPPDFDSGWLPLTAGVDQLIEHGLGGAIDNYVVDLQGYNSSLFQHQLYYGGKDEGALRRGAYWHALNATHVTVKRRDEDNVWQQGRVRIWVDPEPAYDSGWLPVALGETFAAHNLGGDLDQYVVEYECRENLLSPPHKMLYGGVEFGSATWSGAVTGQQWGSFWFDLTNSSVRLMRLADDQYCAWARGRIFQRQGGHYDSGWLPTSRAGGYAIGMSRHDSDACFTYLEQKSSAHGVNHAFIGSASVNATAPSGPFEQGAHWQSFINGRNIWRWDDDDHAEELRLRVWCWSPFPALPAVRMMLGGS